MLGYFLGHNVQQKAHTERIMKGHMAKLLTTVSPAEANDRDLRAKNTPKNSK